MERRIGFPIFMKPQITTEDLTYLSFSANDGNDFSGLSEWSQNWSVKAKRSENLKNDFGRFENKTVAEFTRKLFTKFKEIGILSSRKATKFEPNKEWLVLRSQDAELSDDKLTVGEILSAPVGSFLFLHEPDSEITDEVLAQHDIELSTENVFFYSFGGLRDSPPFFGGDHFVEYPYDVAASQITSRRYDEKVWLGSEVIHVRGRCDYTLLKSSGEVGLMRLEFDREFRIEVVAPTFQEYLNSWLNTPRPLEYNVFGEYIGEE